MSEVVPIRVKVRKGARHDKKGGYIYPKFNDLPAAIRKDMDWAVYVDVVGIGQNYDRTVDLGPGGEVDTCILVEEDFAVAAEAAFPGDVEIMTEAEFEAHYDNKTAFDEDDVNDNVTVLQALVLREQLGEDVTAEKADILNPDHPNKKGRVRNQRKTWERRKAAQGVKIKKKVGNKKIAKDQSV